MSQRQQIPKKVREQIYNKYKGHCAYCGCGLEYKDMQVDHISSVYWHNGTNDIENLMPSCRMCNFYKSTFSIEDFRKRIETVYERLENMFIYRLAKKYGLIKEDKHEIKFYFEMEEK